MQPNHGQKEIVSGIWGISSPFDGTWEFSFAEAGKERSGEIGSEAIIAIIISGSLEVVVDGIENIVHTNEMFIISPGSVFRSKTLEYSEAVICRFPIETIPELHRKEDKINISDKMVDSDKHLKTLEVTRMLSDYLNLMVSYVKNGIPIKELYKIKRQELFYLIFSSYPPEKLAPFLHPVSKGGMSFRIFVVKNWKKARNVNELAAMANLSTSGFIKKFHKSFNESPYQWMLRKKAECILEEIAENKLPLKVIADKYHFSTYAHFGAFCKAQFGTTPKDLIALAGKGTGNDLKNKKT